VRAHDQYPGGDVIDTARVDTGPARPRKAAPPLPTTDLGDYFLAHSARADLCRRLGKIEEARASYEKALSLPRPQPSQRFLRRRLNELMNRAEA
jgi:predicted RNA polymerase sigma factor